MKNSPLRRRFGYAWAGIRAAWASEHSLRTHTAAAVIVLLVMAWLHPAIIWWALVGGMITLILSMELLNTAIEQLADHLHPDEHPRIKLVKDCAAAAVLLLSIGAVWVGVLMLVAVYTAR